MEQQRLAAYLKLIQDLLSCPQGEEWIHLKRHEPLVDAQFVQVMEQVASQLDKHGNPETATFLYNWAAKLHHIFFKEVQLPSPEEDLSEAYLHFIEKLLSCPNGLEDDLILEHKSLVGPGLVHEMREVARQLRAQEEIATALSLEKFASQLNQMWIYEHNFQPHMQKTPIAETPAKKPDFERGPVVKMPVGSDMSEQVAGPSAVAVTPAPADSFEPLADESEDPWSTSSTDEVVAPEAVSVGELEPIAEPKATSMPEPITGSKAMPLGENGSQAVLVGRDDAIAEGLKAIATALQQLNQTLRSGDAPQSAFSHRDRGLGKSSSPLAHLEALERAHNAKWQLTTEEVEKLIGVKPRCHEKETVYQRGNWRFIKVGQLGNQIAWQVSKVH
ncbi:MAG: hypothetical protein WBD47_06140 [Phormidesmis sp.]